MEYYPRYPGTTSPPILFEPLPDRCLPPLYQFDAFIRADEWVLHYNPSWVKYYQSASNPTPDTTLVTLRDQELDLKRAAINIISKTLGISQLSTPKDSTTVATRYDCNNLGVPGHSHILSLHKSITKETYSYPLLLDEPQVESDQSIQNPIPDTKSGTSDGNNTCEVTITYSMRFEKLLVPNHGIEAPQMDLDARYEDNLWFLPLRYLYGICILPYVFIRESPEQRKADEAWLNDPETNLSPLLSYQLPSSRLSVDGLDNPFPYDIIPPRLQHDRAQYLTFASKSPMTVHDVFPHLYYSYRPKIGSLYTNYQTLIHLANPVKIVIMCLNPVVNGLKDIRAQKPISSVSPPEYQLDPITSAEFRYLQSIIPRQIKEQFIQHLYPFSFGTTSTMIGDSEIELTVREKIDHLWTFSMIQPHHWQDYFLQAQKEATERRIRLFRDLYRASTKPDHVAQ